MTILTVMTVQARQWTTGEVGHMTEGVRGDTEAYPRITLTFNNESSQQRQEVVEVSWQEICKQLGLAVDEDVVIENRM